MDENQLCNLLASKASPPSRIVGMIFLYMYPRIWPHVKKLCIAYGMPGDCQCAKRKRNWPCLFRLCSIQIVYSGLSTANP